MMNDERRKSEESRHSDDPQLENSMMVMISAREKHDNDEYYTNPSLSPVASGSRNHQMRSRVKSQFNSNSVPRVAKLPQIERQKTKKQLPNHKKSYYEICKNLCEIQHSIHNESSLKYF